MARFSEPTRAWFSGAFAGPTPAQAGAWDAITSGDNALVIAPTGSGKTLAGFLWSIDALLTGDPVDPKKRLRVLYVSPLKALAVDVERNLRTPLAGITAAAARMGATVPEVAVGVRTGDTPAAERRRFTTAPPDILITTPESLFLLLTSRAREQLRFVETVIVDEVHALVHNKRGAHLALSLERLDALGERPAQRLGLSATVRPPDEVATFLGGGAPVRVIAPGSDKRFDLTVVVPLEDMADPALSDPPAGRGPGHGGDAAFEGAPSVEDDTQATGSSVWPHVEERLLDLVEAHSSTIVFVNSRRLAERLCARLNEIAEERAAPAAGQGERDKPGKKVVARAHHGSVAREQRVLIEEDLKAGRLPAVVATSSLELGIDMASVDLVVQVESPSSVASGLQRVGRAGHQVGEVSRGVFFPKFRGDLLETSVVVERMKQGAIEEMHYPRNPLDVLAQQIVAMVAMDDWAVDDLEATVRRAAPFAELPRSALEATLDMLSGRYPSHEFAELRPRLNWDRGTGMLGGRPGAQRLAVTSGGTIPDRGLFGVFLASGSADPSRPGRRVGELDEEMVYESRPGDTFVLGSSSWLIEDITHDRVLVTPAPGAGGMVPFWHGDAPGRPVELGAAMGSFVRDLSSKRDKGRLARLETAGLDRLAARNLLQYLGEQRDATGIVPDDRTIVVERFRDEIGDWRVCIHSFFGARVHAPWAQAIESRVREDLGLEVQCIYTDDGIVVRLPEADEAPPGRFVTFDPEEITEIVTLEVGSSALFASRFRECAARSLLLPRRRPGSRTPLWQQRQRSSQLLQVASKHESFPVVLEAYRECLQDVFDLPALSELMASIARREVRVVEVDTTMPSPFASSLQFGFVASFMYEGDVPLAERRAQALSLDRSLLAEIMGREELRELIDDAALAQLELELQLLVDERKFRDADGLHDALRLLGDLSRSEIAQRARRPAQVDEWIEALQSSRRVIAVRVAGDERFVAIEDAARYRDALGAALPTGVPAAFLESVSDPLGDLVARAASRRGPFAHEDVARRYSLGVAIVRDALGRLELDGKVLEGEFRPGGTGREWIDVEVLRRLRRMSLAAFRKEVEPAPPEALARFAQAWHHMDRSGPTHSTIEDLFRVVEQLQGAPLVASAVERTILPARLPGYTPALLDQLGASGELVWCGAGAVGSDDGWVSLALADRADLLLPMPADEAPSGLAGDIHDALKGSGALFFRQIAEQTSSTDDTELLLALWELVWAGLVTNDTLQPLRALLGGSRSRRAPRSRRRRSPSFPARLGPPAGAGRWSLVGERSADPTRRAHALAEQLLERHGIVTRGALAAERVSGGFAAVYPVLKAMEESGRCRRGYFVDGLGGAQFALAGAVDRMRSLMIDDEAGRTQVLAATDPANPYGAALPWPERDQGESGAGRKMGARAGRKAGAVVVLVGGRLVLYVERGGRTLLSYTEYAGVLGPAIDALVLAAREGLLGNLSVERADGEAVLDSPLAQTLVDAGLRLTSRGLRLRA